MADDNVVPMRGLITTVDEPPAQVLEKAKDWGMKRCVVLGEGQDGRLVWGASFSDAETINWLLDLAKHDIIYQARNNDIG